MGLDVDGYSEVRTTLQIHNIGTDVPHASQHVMIECGEPCALLFTSSHPTRHRRRPPPLPRPLLSKTNPLYRY